MLRVTHIQRRPHVQHAGIDMTKHTVAQPVAVEQLTEFSNIIGQVFRRHAGIFGERYRFGGPFGIPQQPNRFFPHRVDALDAVQLVTNLPADYARLVACYQFIQALTQGRHLAINQFGVITGELDDIQPQHLLIRNVGNELANRMPDNILPRQIEHLRVDRFDRKRLRFHHKRRVAQRRVKGIVLNVDQPAHFRQTGDIQPRFGNKRQRAFGTGQDSGQIKFAHVVVEHVAQIVTREETVKFREFIDNQLPLRFAALIYRAIDTPDRRLFCAQGFRQRRRDWLSVKNIAADQHRAHPEYVIGGFTVDQRPLPGGVGVDHPAKRGAVAGRQFRRKKVAVRFKKLIKLVLNDPRLHPHPPFFGVDFNNAVHIAGHIDDDPGVQRLAIRAGAASARGKDQRFKTLFRRQSCQQSHVCRGTGE